MSSSIVRTNIRPLDIVRDVFVQHEAARVNASAFLRVILHQFIAQELPVRTGRELAQHLSGRSAQVVKTADATICITCPPDEHAGFVRYAKVRGGHKFGALVQSALVWFFLRDQHPTLFVRTDPAKKRTRRSSR